jgi:hypothetical protein
MTTSLILDSQVGTTIEGFRVYILLVNGGLHCHVCDDEIGWFCLDKENVLWF